MLKLTSILFSIFYSLLIAGLPVNIHYCMGNLMDISIFEKADNCCCDTMEDSGNCCMNDRLLLQFEVKEQLVAGKYFELNCQEFTGPGHYTLDVHDFIAEEDPLFKFFENPPAESIPLWLKNVNFTFYG